MARYAFFASQLNVTERIQVRQIINQHKMLVEREVERRTADLRDALEAKTILLHEVDHRVKNNLTMIGSLLRLQARSIDGQAIIAKLDNMLERIDAFAVVHRQLYQSQGIRAFDIGRFAENLARDVVRSNGRTDIRLVLKVGTLFVDSAHAAALGLILNEILTNAIKHGFAEGRAGTLSLFAGEEERLGTIRICDDGLGMPCHRYGVPKALARL